MATDPQLPARISAAIKQAQEIASAANKLADQIDVKHSPSIWVGLSKQRHEKALQTAQTNVNAGGAHLWELAQELELYQATIVKRLAAEKLAADEKAWAAAHDNQWPFSWPPSS